MHGLGIKCSQHYHSAHQQQQDWAERGTQVNGCAAAERQHML
jgi:hypothetical protein